ncbi:MAG: hypothetical protein ABEK84_06160 [Salinibacter sp.]
MSYDDLKEHDIFLPEEEWGDLDLETSVSIPTLIATFVLGAVSCVMMVLGGGGPWTWIGAVLFIGFMFAFALVSNAGIERQHRRIEALHERHGTPAEAE